MTRYEKLMEKAENCLKMAKRVVSKDIQAFFFNASKGFEKKAKQLTIEEALA